MITVATFLEMFPETKLMSSVDSSDIIEALQILSDEDREAEWDDVYGLYHNVGSSNLDLYDSLLAVAMDTTKENLARSFAVHCLMRIELILHKRAGVMEYMLKNSNESLTRLVLDHTLDLDKDDRDLMETLLERLQKKWWWDPFTSLDIWWCRMKLRNMC